VSDKYGWQAIADCPGVPCNKPECIYYDQPDDFTWTCSIPRIQDVAAALVAANARADEAEACIKALMLSMRLWGAEEDGIPDDPTTGAWAAYSRAKCLLCPEREAYRCTEYDLKSCAICEPCAACGKIRKHSFASFFVEDADGHFTVTCNDTCARNAAAAREAVRR
jgi:hypothetical protein